MRKVVAIGCAVVVAAALAVVVERATDDDAAVLGSKVARCTTDDGSAGVDPGPRTLSADNAPLTVVVEGGRVTSVLAPPLKVRPDDAAAAAVASFTIGRPDVSGGAFAMDVALHNRTDCPVRLGPATATATRGATAVRAPIRFAGSATVLQPGDRLSGSLSVPIDGDGTYQITATADAEFGRVR